MEPDRSWGAVVIDGKGNYLLVRHASGGHWDSPKGHGEEDESPAETALREIREEASVEAEIIDGFTAEAQWILPAGRPKHTVYFLARCLRSCKPEGPQGEILEIAWLPYGEARDLITYDTGKMVLDRAEEFLKQSGSGTFSDDKFTGNLQGN